MHCERAPSFKRRSGFQCYVTGKDTIVDRDTWLLEKGLYDTVLIMIDIKAKSITSVGEDDL